MQKNVFYNHGKKPLCVYVLELEHDCYFVGRTILREFTLDDIVQKTIHPMSRDWLVAHRPLKVLVVYPNSTSFDEDKYVKMFMKYYGVENVRGGSYSSILLDPNAKKFIENEIRYAEWSKRTQNQDTSSSLLSSQLQGFLGESILTATTEGPKEIKQEEKEQTSVSTWLYHSVSTTAYETYVTTYEILSEIGHQLWPWKTTS